MQYFRDVQGELWQEQLFKVCDSSGVPIVQTVKKQPVGIEKAPKKRQVKPAALDLLEKKEELPKKKIAESKQEVSQRLTRSQTKAGVK